MKYTSSDRKYIVDFITNNFGVEQCREVKKILRESGSECSVNNNGTFVPMAILKDEVLDKIVHFIDFWKHNKKDEIDYEEKREKIMTTQLNAETDIDVVDSETTVAVSVAVPDFNNTINFDLDSDMFQHNNIFKEYEKDIPTDYVKFEPGEGDIQLNINLKRTKKKFTGVKAKILKKYRDISKCDLT